MRLKVFAILFFSLTLGIGSVLAYGQNPETACFPSCTDAELLVANTGVSTELSAAVTTTGETTWTVASAAALTAFPTTCWADQEIVKVTGKSGNDLTVVRGFEGTTAATHSLGAAVVCGPTALYHNQMSADLQVHQANLLFCTSTSELTISSGSITIPYPGCFSVDAEADAASDDLTAITCSAGVRFKLFPENDGRTVVVKETPGAIEMQSDADFTMNNVFDSWDGWCRTANVAIEENRHNGGA